MTDHFVVPGVYAVPRPLVAATPFPRTDVVGFAGFDPRVRDGSTPCQLTGTPPVGHRFQVDIGRLQFSFGRVKSTLPAQRDLVLSVQEASIPVAPGGAVSYAVAAVLAGGPAAARVVAGGPVPGPTPPVAPTADQVRLAAAGAAFVRIADVDVRRTPAGDRVFPLVRPRTPPVRCDDWHDFELQLGPLGDDDGTFLARAVRAFFANGGRRCWIALTPRPIFGDEVGLPAALDDLVGVAGSPEAQATGLERLLLVSEVA